MCQRLLGDARLFSFLRQCDEEMAAETLAGGCRCGGALHRADYPRKPRGGSTEEGHGDEKRLSFCCDREGCRKRATPPSVRFLGRRVYLGAVVVLVSAMVCGPTPARVARLGLELGISARTLRRWREWWRTTFVASAFWKAARGRLARPLAMEEGPGELLERFSGDERERLVATLRLLAPLTTTSARYGMAF
jgi:hypothetical protein